MKGKIFTPIQFHLVTTKEKTSFWEISQDQSFPENGKTYLRPKYEIGEILYLKEPYDIDSKGKVAYKYDSSNGSLTESERKWKNKLFMPEKYARYFIEICSSKEELLENIYCDDCLKRGLTPDKCHITVIANKLQNPLIRIYEFELIECDLLK